MTVIEPEPPEPDAPPTEPIEPIGLPTEPQQATIVSDPFMPSAPAAPVEPVTPDKVQYIVPPGLESVQWDGTEEMAAQIEAWVTASGARIEWEEGWEDSMPAYMCMTDKHGLEIRLFVNDYLVHYLSTDEWAPMHPEQFNDTFEPYNEAQYRH
jgi:hypothetical protein